MTNNKVDSVDAVKLVDEHSDLIKSLRGFQKHHRLPTSNSPRDLRYLYELAEPELDQDLQTVFAALRKSYGLKRKEISVDGPFEGGGVISTPFFKYEIQVSFEPTNLSRIVWRRSIGDITEPSRVFSGPFESVFGQRFTVLEITTHAALDLESIVDHIEDAESDSVSVDYDKDLTWCEIQIVDSIISVIIEPDSIRVTSRREIPPVDLLESFIEIQQQFISSLDFDGFSFVT